MVLLYLKGGLGNQMFQYAAGQALATHLKVPFKIDKSYYDEQHYQGDILNNFFEIPYFRDIIEKSFESTAQTATAQELDRFKLSVLRKLFERLMPKYSRSIYRAPLHGFDENFFKLKKNVLLKGLFQTEKFFKPYSHVIKKEFTFNATIRNRNQTLVDEMQTSTSVSIHVRRGDYVKNPLAIQWLGALPLEYYEKGKEYLLQQLGQNLSFYVFSDGIEWAKTQFNHFGNVVYIDKSYNKTDVDEMYLMSQCKHNIVANSSFSWWSAWLNPNPEKIIIAPAKWFNDPTLSSKDLVPENWVRL